MSNLRDQFLHWQCLIRQRSVRHHEGIPNAGMQPMVKANESDAWTGPITVLINKSADPDMTSQLQFIAQKTQDPKERRDTVLKHLAESHYQKSKEFDDTLTAIFSFNSDTSRQLVEKKSINLKFHYTSHEYIIPCKCELLSNENSHYQFTYWHNYLFNTTMPGSVDIVGFLPDWSLTTYRSTNE